MENHALQNSSRRNFLRTAPVAAVAGLTLADAALFASSASGQYVTIASGTGFQLLPAQRITDSIKALQAKPGNDNLFGSNEFTVVLTTETAKSATEFEWHEFRDHVLLILDGSTVYEVGGTPKNGRNTKPGEWLAPAAVGATTLTLKKGDMLVIPRGTLHKRSTAESVTFFLISPMGTVKAT
jgi:mannose-6-phosphate isomerase-like protein (cupin superfamily)